MSTRRKPPPTIREQQVDLTRARLLDAAVALLESGVDDLTLRAVAREAGVAERTLYRYFETREALVRALLPRLQERTSAPLPDDVSNLPTYARTLFGVFEDNTALVSGMLASSGARAELEHSRARNLRALRSLLDRAFPKAPEQERAAAASALRVLLSGTGWTYLRLSCGLSNDEIVAHADWTIATLLGRLRRSR